MALGRGIAQATVDALPYSTAGAVLAYAGGATKMTVTLALSIAAVVWIVLFSLLLLFSFYRYRERGKWLPITRAVVYHTLWAIPG